LALSGTVSSTLSLNRLSDLTNKSVTSGPQLHLFLNAALDSGFGVVSFGSSPSVVPAPPRIKTLAGTLENGPCPIALMAAILYVTVSPKPMIVF